jgi:hypothetical protein
MPVFIHNNLCVSVRVCALSDDVGYGARGRGGGFRGRGFRGRGRGRGRGYGAGPPDGPIDELKVYVGGVSWNIDDQVPRMIARRKNDLNADKQKNHYVNDMIQELQK